MAGTVTVEHRRRPGVSCAIFTWLSDGDGDADLDLGLVGEILKVVTNPGAAAPSDNYDLTLIDEDGLDVLEGAGGDRDTSNAEVVYPVAEVTLGGTGTDAAARPCVVCGPVTFTIANAGAAKNGVARIYYR